jgi:hypothetical protein
VLGSKPDTNKVVAFLCEGTQPTSSCHYSFYHAISHIGMGLKCI